MKVAKVFTTGRSQAVRIPKAFQFDTKEVIIQRFGNGILLIPKNSDWQGFLEALNEFEPDFKIEREPQIEQVREDFL
ncbi:antitoxin [Dichelobacter nodosus]|uniref:Virulence-associated protein B n=2 Tax=Dichelobacter nodosus TaxID=870 RepID=VAPB_DICNO|nr:type II toxin-antitoxin system VapB family antitoxin [Dichelobacter nodosus]Q46558.1 RecName: Full=Virulence-associated protein B [Dichelobacter nodosus]AAA20206.1 virulence associated protein B [Dichelobacter nodosus]AAA23350.1 VapB [Dichelobacter nodosus]AAB00942.1 virulence-associated protein B [Dichelobacter nodosus]AAC44626.1 virulence associated protein B [Dichelobacter nodosus]ABQ13843.1 virulence-associated protein VapB2 [Dichelobacter nodosus VCS1703A]